MITIVSHNACWFQGFPYDGLEPDAPSPDVFERLVALYQSFQPDVVCVQEVQHARMAVEIADALGMHGEHASGGAYPVYGCATFARTLERIADGTQCDPAPHRAWQVSNIESGGQTLSVANIHLTSDRFVGEEAAAVARLEDLGGLLECGVEIDLICGDFNEGPREAAAILLESSGYTDAAVAMDVNLPSTGVGKARSDQIWVRNDWLARIGSFGAADWVLLDYHAPGKRVLSDHLPLALRLND